MLGNVVSPVFLNQHVSEHLLDSWSVAQSCLTLQGHELQHAKLPCPPVSPGICSNSCPLSHCLTICCSVTTFSSCPQSFPASGSFPMSALHIKWPKYWSFSFNISPSSEYPGLIFFRMDWLDLLGVQRTLKSLLQHHSSKASVLWHSVFFIVQLLHPYMTTGKTIALTRWTFVSKVISLLFNALSRLVIPFLPRRWASFNFMAADTIYSDFGAQENNICYCFHLFPICFLGPE